MAPHRAYLVSGNRPIPPTTNCKRWFGENEGHIIVTDSTAKPGPDSLIAAARAAEKQGKLPPVHLWDPPFCGDLDMEIRRDGRGSTRARRLAENRWCGCFPRS
jgi:hypothetical protein